MSRTSQELSQRVKELQQHERELLERIAALEAKQNTPVLSQQTSMPEMLTSTAETATPPDIHQVPPTTVFAPEMHSLHGIQWRGFGEVDYKVLNQRTAELGTYGFVPGSSGNFYTGDFDLFLTSRLTDAEPSVVPSFGMIKEAVKLFTGAIALADAQEIQTRNGYQSHQGRRAYAGGARVSAEVGVTNASFDYAKGSGRGS